MAQPVYNIVLSEQTLKAIVEYKADIIGGRDFPGARLENELDDLPNMSIEHFIESLLATKLPRIFAESEIRCDGSDWNVRELALLGDINVTMFAKIFDNGTWSPSDRNFHLHTPPLEGHLLFTPGALLAVGPDFKGQSPDYVEIVSPQGTIDQAKYNRLIERRLLPLLVEANESARQEGKPALITLPGIGCGAFAGKFKGKMGQHLNTALQTLLQKHGSKLTNIGCIYFDPFAECGNEKKDIHGISYRVRPSTLNPGKPQLANPNTYQETGDDFSNYTLYKIVAWDHASLPGNDFFGSSRFTDDGVSAAATNSMESVTGIKGAYTRGMYMPPEGYDSWEDVALQNNVHLVADQNIRIVTDNGDYLDMNQYGTRSAKTKPAPPKP